MCAVEIKKARRPVGSLQDMDIKPNWDDPEFCQLYQRYLSTYRAYLNALRKRRELRARYAEKRKYPRRPVGSQKGNKPRAVAQRRPVAKAARKPFKVNMGDILGIVTFVEHAAAIPDNADESTKDLFKSLYDKVQLQHYHSAKRKYFDAKLALVRYRAKQHKARAKNHAIHQANLQYLGAESGMETDLQTMQEELAPVLEMAIQMYRSDPRPGTLRFVFESAVDGQLVGLDEGTVMDDFSSLLSELHKEGKLKPGK